MPNSISMQPPQMNGPCACTQKLGGNLEISTKALRICPCQPHRRSQGHVNISLGNTIGCLLRQLQRKTKSQG